MLYQGGRDGYHQCSRVGGNGGVRNGSFLGCILGELNNKREADNMNYLDVQREYDNMRAALKPLKKLMLAHTRQCENDCNGEGYIPRKGFFRCDNPSAYVSEDVTVFDAEIEKIEKQIGAACVEIFGTGRYRADFQHDPRGYTVRVYQLEHVPGDVAAWDITTLVMERK